MSLHASPSYVTFRFRDRDAKYQESFDSLRPDLECNLLDPTNDPGLIDRYIGHLASGDMRLADMCFFRGGVPFWLGDLSSGERQYALAILGFIYCGSERCTVFYDEPENSLHLEWQLSIVKDLAEVAGDQILDATLVIATHSP